MAVARRRGIAPDASPDPQEDAFLQLFGTLAANPSVGLIGQDPVGGYIDLWIRLSDANEANELAIYDALAMYHATEGVTTPIDLHLVLADEPDVAFPGDLRLLYRRR